MLILKAHLFFVLIALLFYQIEDLGFELRLYLFKKSGGLDFLEDLLFEALGGFHWGGKRIWFINDNYFLNYLTV